MFSGNTLPVVTVRALFYIMFPVIFLQGENVLLNYSKARPLNLKMLINYAQKINKVLHFKKTIMRKLLPVLSGFLLGLSLIFNSTTAQSQTTIGLGEIAFTGMNTDTPDNFCFILLKDITNTTSINITDHGWLGIGGFAANGGDATISWTAGEDMACGTQICISGTTTSNDGGYGNSGTVGGSALNLSGLGDQLFIYQGSAPTAGDQSNFITGIQGNGGGWDADAASSTTSSRPSVFTDNVNVMVFSSAEQDDQSLNPALCGSLTSDITVLYLEANWVRSNSVLTLPSCTGLTGGACPVPCTDPDVPTLVATPSTICPGGSSTITITGALNDATDWEVYTTSCGVGSHGNTSTGSYSTGALASTTTFFIRGEDGLGCVDESTGLCGSVTVTVQDITDPVITVCAPTPPNISANGSCQGTATDLTGGVTATDNCTASPTITQSPIAGSTLGLGTTTITLTATDGSGNTATCTVNQTVVDDTDPVITVCAPTPPNISANASCQGTATDLTGGVTATDNCTGSPVITQSPIAGSTLGLGTTTITLTAADGSGNTTSCTVNQTVVDDTDPVITVCAPTPPNISANASCQGTATDLTGGVTATDNCTGSPVITQSPPSGSTLGLGTTTITLTATDGAGNTTSCTVNQTVVDDTDPVITVCAPTPPNISANASCQGTATDLTGGVTATDNCTGSPVITQSPPSGSTLGLGTTTITLTATDGSGNTTSCTVNQTVVDDTDPVITVCAPTPPNISANASCQGTATDLTGGVTATDNCTGSPVITQSPPSGSTLGLGTTTITLTATDGSGNTTTCTVNQTVVDDTPPSITCPGNTTEAADASCNVSLPDYTGLAITADNCTGSPTVTQSPLPGTIISGAGTIQTVTLTSTDGSGNTADCTFDVTITSTDDASFNYSAGSYCTNGSDPTPTITGTPGGTFTSAPVGLSIHPGAGVIDLSASTPGAYTVTYTTDACGLTANQPVTILGPDDASFTYPLGIYCTSDVDPTPTITGLGGGSFTGTAGVVFVDGSPSPTGIIDLSASTPGAQTITYTTAGPCPNASVQPVTIQLCTTSQLRAIDCGATLTTLNQFIYADEIPGVEGYQFRFDDGAGGVESYIRLDGVRKMKPSWVSIVDYSMTFDVDVRVKIAGIWGNFGPVCQVTTPALNNTTQLQQTYCGTTLGSMTDVIACDMVLNATAYQFRFTDGPSVFTYIKSGGNNTIQPAWVTGLLLNTTYTVDVRAKYNSVWGNYGPVCQLTTPVGNPNTTELTSSYCNTSQNVSTYVYCTFVSGASHYQFRLTDQNPPNNTLVKVSTSNKFKPSQISGITNTTYDVEVRAKIGGVWGPYGTICGLTISGASSMVQGPIMVHRDFEGTTDESSLDVHLYPNPTSGLLTLEMNQGSKETVQMQVLNSLGQVVFAQQLTGTQRYQIDLSPYNSGLFYVQFFTEEGVITKKVIKH
jgi:hypothetical protein